MTTKKKMFLEETMKKNSYSGNITGFSRCVGCGKCCRINACACVPDDFNDLSLDAIEKIIDTGNFMITASYEPTTKSGGIPIEVFPYISAREVACPENGINITMMHSRCSMLGSDGCKFGEDERPSQGLLLIPESNSKCKCMLDTPTDFWMDYKEKLDIIIKRRTGKISQELFEEELFPRANSIKRKIQMAVLYNEPVSYQEYMVADAMRSLGVFYGLFGEKIGDVMNDFIDLAPVESVK